MSEFRLLTQSEMEQIPGIQDPIPSSMFAVGAVDEKGLAAACGVFLVVHADPIWVREDLRLNGIAKRLQKAAFEEVASRRLGSEVFFSMSETIPDPATQAKLAEEAIRCGAQELKARFFVVPVGDPSDG
jgi:hypothetical protein